MLCTQVAKSMIRAVPDSSFLGIRKHQLAWSIFVHTVQHTIIPTSAPSPDAMPWFLCNVQRQFLQDLLQELPLHRNHGIASGDGADVSMIVRWTLWTKGFRPQEASLGDSRGDGCESLAPAQHPERSSQGSKEEEGKFQNFRHSASDVCCIFL